MVDRNSQFVYEGKGDILLLACGALAAEIIALIRMNGWDHFHLHCLPAKLHLYPDKIPHEVEKAVNKFQSEFKHIFVVYADCGTGGLLRKKCDEMGIEMVPGPHCYAFFEGVEKFNKIAENEITSFYLTDFLVRQFNSFIIKPLGLDKHPNLKEMYFGNYTKLVYLAQTEDQDLTRLAKDYAELLELEYERRFTGYGDLAQTLNNLQPNR
ncbi:MAG: DUF1638 domain-containing protein [Paracoccaceae bacterium]|nr:DUF1638 domain-containing protein [Paracoccaceae bacterium]MDE2673788.1 DUF1638 domain-containing protein [Paracoccaceae bacterium]MXZ49631.1 DUF1638 domain-containing protein [Paracoccaceae bacterium]MYF47114.1 DUF1638 domain-containing protein [Paracoccaceae bacterium]MYI92201.1 DUF1638 domain-containing protein [Paracoccaceae bacterium]